MMSLAHLQVLLHRAAPTLAALACLALPVHADDAVAPAPAAADARFAQVGAVLVTQGEYEVALQMGMRKRFYHGKPPAAELDKVRAEIADDVIDRAALLQEAQRLGLKADAAGIQQTLDGYDKQYADSPRWKESGKEMLAKVKQQLEQTDLLQQLEARARTVADPSEAELKAYYDTHAEKFTEPERQAVSLILLGVDPSSPNAVWQAAEEEGARLVERLKAGADFAEQAKLQSKHASSANGGDMGYLHKGMLSEKAEAALTALKPGEISTAIRILEGIAIFRLNDRKSAQLRSLDEVRKRAADLWRRERSQEAWTAYKRDVRARTKIERYDGPSGSPAAAPQAEQPAKRPT